MMARSEPVLCPPGRADLGSGEERITLWEWGLAVLGLLPAAALAAGVLLIAVTWLAGSPAPLP
jgi:hypothetical protein